MIFPQELPAKNDEKYKLSQNTLLSQFFYKSELNKIKRFFHSRNIAPWIFETGIKFLKVRWGVQQTCRQCDIRNSSELEK